MSDEEFENEKKFKPLNQEQEVLVITIIIENLKSANIYYRINEGKILDALTHLRQMDYEIAVFNILQHQIQQSIINYSEIDSSEILHSQDSHITIGLSVIEDFINTPIAPDPTATLSGLLMLIEQVVSSSLVDLDELVISVHELKNHGVGLNEKLLARIKECNLKK